MDTIVKGSARTLTVRLQNPDGSPYDLTNTSAISARFLNDDQSILTVTAAKTSDEGGSLTVPLTAIQTAALMAQDPAPFSLVLTTTGGAVVVNLPDQLTIQNEINA